MYNLKKASFLAFAIFLVSLSFGQTIPSGKSDVSGTVYGKDEKGNLIPLPGASLHWYGTLVGTSTDTSGSFHINFSEKGQQKLISSFLGFKNDTIEILKRTKKIEIVLEPDLLNMKAVVINPDQSSTYVSKVNPVNTQIITSRELVKAACCNLSESFETNASVDVNYSDAISGAKQIEMLGLAGVYSQIMVENIPAIRGLANSYGLSYIPGPWMESIQISKGTSTVKNGYESVTGQINVEYKKPEKSDKLYISLYGDAIARTELNFNTNKKLNDKWSTMLLAHGEIFQNKLDLNKDKFIDLPLVKQYNFMNRWNYHGKKGFEAKFALKVLQEQRDGGQINFNKAQDYGTTNAYGIQVNTLRVEAFSKTGFVFLKTPYKSIGFINSFTYHDQNSFFGLNKYDGQQSSYYSNLLYQSIIKTTDHKIVVGASYMYDHYNELFKDSTINRIESVPGVFGEYTYSYKDVFSLIAGFRYDNHNVFGNFYTPRIHLRYKIGALTTFRASAGKAYRVANSFSENASLLATSKKLVFDEKLMPEEAWNYGVFMARDVLIKKFKATINLDYHRTDFKNQSIVDMDRYSGEIHFYNLKGNSFSNSFQAELNLKPVKRLDVLLAYRINDVRSTYNNELRSKPLTKKVKGLLTISYATKYDKWQFDYTLQYNGKSRLPDTLLNAPDIYSPDYFMMNTQVLKRFKKFELYLGMENILNFMQMETIVGATDPFGTEFDATKIWGPIMGRKVYGGIRFILK